MKKFFISIIFCLSSIILSQTTDIITLRENDSLGDPIFLNQQFTISGIVTSTNQFGNNGPASLQDNTAGISVYGSDFSGTVNIGDSVTVTSTIAQFNGLTQFDFFSNGSSVSVHKTNIIVEPKTVTILEILNQEWNGIEEIEGSLIRINDVQINSSGAFSGGTNYSITDPTGTLEMRIDNDVNTIIGSSIPSSNIDIIGILGQYDPSTPRSSGYQILPRFIEDLITNNEPLILSPIIPADITPNSFTIYFNTIREGNSEVRYGLTNDLEINTIIDEELTTNHKILIDNLEESTLYYCQVLSTNQNGTSQSQIFTASTSSSDTTNGKINIYFNYSVDNSVAYSDNLAIGNVNFKNKLIERINSATYSLDIAVYSFYGLNEVANAIISAKNNRGVKVRVVYDSRDMQSSMQLLADAGIGISQRQNTDGIMHNKFMIVDARDSISSNDWIWTGSWNWNPLNNRNNVLEINDPTLASAYTTEFEEMWGSSDDVPSSSSAQFGPSKSDNTPHIFNIGGKQIELYFSPSDGTESKISNSIISADSSIFFGLLSFTSDPIFSAINSRYSNGISDIRGIIDNVEDTGSEYFNLQSISEVFDYNLSGLFHHKYSIIDSYSSSSDPIVITGSHNWSRSANEKNDENTLIIHDLSIANMYMQEFKARYNELGGSQDFQIPILTNVKNKFKSVNSSLKLFQNYPNPFNPNTIINYTIAKEEDFVKLSVYNSLGEEIEVLVNQKQKAGSYEINFSGEEFSSGIYFYSLKTSDNIITKKMLLLK
ncbi:MAG: T9SS type A sorting domain-containing protein [Ignavibacteriales bacterium]|nr:T9SS type A sorting domain-containing protein [Ignavibacteriales bacterium]